MFVCRCKITTFISFGKNYSLQGFVNGFNLSDGCGVVVSTALSTPCYHYMYTIVRMALHYGYHSVRQKGSSRGAKPIDLLLVKIFWLGHGNFVSLQKNLKHGNGPRIRHK